MADEKDFVLCQKLTAGVLGLAVGDAFGMPYECAKREDLDIYTETRVPDGRFKMRGFQPGMPAYFYKEPIPPGVWTDDTAMTLAEMESIARLGRIDPEDMMQNFCRWNDDGAFSATGVAIGQGKQTLQALERYKAGTPAIRCGGAGERDNGDGSLMRMLPFVFAQKMLERDGVTVAELSSLTHAHPISVRACEIYVQIAREVLQGVPKEDCVNRFAEEPSPFDRLWTLKTLPDTQIRSKGYVVWALEAALWSFLTTNSFEDCILEAVNLGGDADTIAAIAGSLAGLCYGEAYIPGCWLGVLHRNPEIRALCRAFYAAVSGQDQSGDGPEKR